MPGATREERRRNMLGLVERLPGARLTSTRRSIVRSTTPGTGIHWNRAIAYMMLNSGMIEGNAQEVLDLFSVSVRFA